MNQNDILGSLILVVDDNEAKRYTISHILKKAGFEIIEASNGEEALDMAAARLPSLMVLDVNLPDINGFDVCRKIKSNPATEMISILHLSASFISSKDRAYGLEEGADAFLTQPVEPQELLATIRALLRLRYAEEKAQTLAREWEATFDAITDGICLLDDQWHIIRCNTASKKIAADCGELKGQKWHAVHDCLQNNTRDPLEVMHESGRSADTEFQQENGRWMRLVAQPVRKGEKIIGAVCILSDVSERVQARQDLMDAKNRAESASVAKSEFLANMSHEIRTPMNAVIGLSNILAMSNPLTPSQREYISTLQLSAQSLLSLINDLLDIAKIESESVTLEKTEFNLRQLLEEIVSIMAVKAKEKNIQLILDYDVNLQNAYTGDTLRIRQILMNLVSNAIKFTATGSVTLRVERKNASEVCFSVIDTGIGIPEHQIEAIFSKFSQGDSSVTRKYGGTGLGLTITKALVELMGGSISVESNINQGSAFTITIPLPSSNTKVQPQEDISPAKSTELPEMDGKKKKTILLVEDYKPNILVATTILEHLGYAYELAQDGQEALDKLTTSSYDLVLMDVQMPVVDGFTATGRFREWEKDTSASRTPIIGITAFALSGDKEKCIEAGMDDYISKPFSATELEAKIVNFIHD